MATPTSATVLMAAPAPWPSRPRWTALMWLAGLRALVAVAQELGEARHEDDVLAVVAGLGASVMGAQGVVLCLRGEQPGTPPVKRRQYATKQIAVAQMRVTLEATKALWFQAVTEAGPDTSSSSGSRVSTVKPRSAVSIAGSLPPTFRWVTISV